MTKDRAIVMGASAGAVEALSVLLAALPADFSIPVMIVVHLPPDKKSMLASVLQAKTFLKVSETEDKSMPVSGHIYLAPPDYHLLVEKDFSLSLSSEEPVLYSRPSIDVLFETAADAYGAGLTGIILSGANSDGAAGLHAIAAAGGTALVQNPATAYATAMPNAAIAACPAAQVLSLDEISLYLRNMV